MALSTTTILARLMPFGAPSTPSAKGRYDPFAKPSTNDRYLRIAVTSGVGCERPLSALCAGSLRH